MAFTFFFRDLQTLEGIRDHVVPVLRTRRYINIWDAGCASGQEPFSLAIILRESMGGMVYRNVKIHATDIDRSKLFGDIITSGSYAEDDVKRLPEEIQRRYFLPAEKPGCVQVIEEVRQRVQYTQHDLLKLQPIRGNQSLVLCKNVLLHFSDQQRIDVINMFHGALEEGGFLVMEQTQKMPAACAKLFAPVVSNMQLFRKV